MRPKRGWRHPKGYGMAEAQSELEEGIHPGVVAARLGDTEENVREIAAQQGWPISWSGQTAQQILDAHERIYT